VRCPRYSIGAVSATKDATPIILPRFSGRGRPSAEARAQYERDLAAFCKAILQIKSTLDFDVSSRGWCYILEEKAGLPKGDFDKAQAIINDARKSGLLPIDICAEDESRQSTACEDIDDETPNEFAEGWVNYLQSAHKNYTPTSFWENQPNYAEMLVEKIDLKTLFRPVCDEYRVRIANTKGWLDINQRARIMGRFREWEDKGKQCVLLYCGDHDPAGLSISDKLMSLFEEMQRGGGWDPAGLEIERFGLNADFINANRLTWIEGLRTSSGEDLADPRHSDHNKPYVQDYIRRFGARKVEANALVVRPGQGRQLCGRAILRYVDPDRAREYFEQLEEQRDAARNALARRVRP
jgi:hypothetical protein